MAYDYYLDGPEDGEDPIEAEASGIMSQFQNLWDAAQRNPFRMATYNQDLQRMFGLPQAELKQAMANKNRAMGINFYPQSEVTMAQGDQHEAQMRQMGVGSNRALGLGRAMDRMYSQLPAHTKNLPMISASGSGMVANTWETPKPMGRPGRSVAARPYNGGVPMRGQSASDPQRTLPGYIRVGEYIDPMQPSPAAPWNAPDGGSGGWANGPRGQWDDTVTDRRRVPMNEGWLGGDVWMHPDNTVGLKLPQHEFSKSSRLPNHPGFEPLKARMERGEGNPFARPQMMPGAFEAMQRPQGASMMKRIGDYFAPIARGLMPYFPSRGR